MTKFPEDVPFIEAGIDTVPVDWTNQRLKEYGEIWRVEMGSGGYLLPALPASNSGGDGKIATIRALLRDYFKGAASATSFAGPRIPIPVDWLNERLLEMRTTWRVQTDREEIKFVDVANSDCVPRAAEATGTVAPTSCESAEITAIPRGIALIFCNQVEWTSFSEHSSFPRNFTCTFDGLEFDVFPNECAPFAAYVVFSGSGSIMVSLALTAPNKEILWEEQIAAANWGEIGTCECAFTISKLKVPQPGIYHWKLRYGEKVLLERPMVFRSRAKKPAVSGH